MRPSVWNAQGSNRILIGEDVAGWSFTPTSRRTGGSGGRGLGSNRWIGKGVWSKRCWIPHSESAIMGCSSRSCYYRTSPIAELMFVDFFGCVWTRSTPGWEIPLYVRGKVQVPVVHPGHHWSRLACRAQHPAATIPSSLICLAQKPWFIHSYDGKGF